MATNAGSVPTVGTRIRFMSQRLGRFLRLDVEIEEHFQVVGDEPDGHDDDVLNAGVVELEASSPETSGSSHGMCGGPLRLCQARR